MMQRLDAAAVRLIELGRNRPQLLRRVLASRLGRRFPKGDWKRILLVHIDDRLAWPQFYPFYHLEDRFAQKGIVFRSISYPAHEGEALIREADAIFLQAPYFLQEGALKSVVERLAEANPRATISFFDWAAPTDVRFADEVADYVAHYAKKALERDHNYYLRAPRSHTALADHFCKTFDLIPDEPTWTHRPDIVDRLVLAPAFATSPLLLHAFEQQGARPRGERPIDVHARFDTAPAALRAQGRVNAGRRTHWYCAMREHARETIGGLADKYQIAWEGLVPKPKFIAELRQSKLCFSPFGFGEICWRDFEAILSGAVIVKPSMSHVECLSDIFHPETHYVPVRWDLADLDEAIARLLADPARCAEIAERALDAVRSYLAGPRIEKLVDKLMSARAPIGSSGLLTDSPTHATARRS